MIQYSYDRISYRALERGTTMSWKDSQDFRRDYPGGYSKGGDVYDGNDRKVGYVTGDGDYRINDNSANDRQLYHNGNSK